MVRRVCLVSSGTGGHLWPAVVLGEALRARGHETFLLTEGRAVERELLERHGCEALALDLRGQGLSRFYRLAHGALEARRILRERGAELVVTTGGRTSVAAGLAARSLGLSLVVLEQNAVVGRGNRLLAPLARRFYLGLPPTRPQRRGVLTGTPLRAEFHLADRAAARRALGADPERPLLLVTGGSQGAGVLNEVVPDALCGLRSPLQVVHLSGPGHDDAVRRRYEPALDHGIDASVRAMAVDMAPLYAAADLVLCRGGGCTIAELIATGRAALVVPYPWHKDQQQLHNARVLERVGAARVVPQSGLDAARLRAELEELLGDPARLVGMGAAAHGLAPSDATRTILEDLERTVLVPRGAA